MQNLAIHNMINCVAKQFGLTPSYWSAIELSNDRTPEGCRGSLEDTWDE